MSRNQLKQFRNKNVTVQGVIRKVMYKNKLDYHSNTKLNVRILLKEVVISGVEVDHIWLYERNNYFDICEPMIGETVKFKGKVNPYVKKNDGLYQEDYGIQRLSSILPMETYDREKPFKR